MRLNVLNSKHAFIMVLKGQMLGMKGINLQYHSGRLRGLLEI